MTSNTEKLERVLGLTDDDFGGVIPDPSFKVMDVPTRISNLPIITADIIEKNKADDYDYARRTMTHLMEQGNEALLGILTLAAEGPNPKVYEVVSTLIKTVSVSKDLIELDNKILPKENTPTQSANTINNNQYNMSQAEAIAAAKIINDKSE